MNESKRIYAGTDEENLFLIYHDGLKAWWKVEAQNYLALYGDVNKGTLYQNKIVEIVLNLLLGWMRMTVAI